MAGPQEGEEPRRQLTTLLSSQARVPSQTYSSSSRPCRRPYPSRPHRRPRSDCRPYPRRRRARCRLDTRRGSSSPHRLSPHSPARPHLLRRILERSPRSRSSGRVELPARSSRCRRGMGRRGRRVSRARGGVPSAGPRRSRGAPSPERHQRCWPHRRRDARRRGRPGSRCCPRGRAGRRAGEVPRRRSPRIDQAREQQASAGGRRHAQRASSRNRAHWRSVRQPQLV